MNSTKVWVLLLMVGGLLTPHFLHSEDKRPLVLNGPRFYGKLSAEDRLVIPGKMIASDTITSKGFVGSGTNIYPLGPIDFLEDVNIGTHSSRLPWTTIWWNSGTKKYEQGPVPGVGSFTGVLSINDATGTIYLTPGNSDLDITKVFGNGSTTIYLTPTPHVNTATITTELASITNSLNNHIASFNLEISSLTTAINFNSSQISSLTNYLNSHIATFNTEIASTNLYFNIQIASTNLYLNTQVGSITSFYNTQIASINSYMGVQFGSITTSLIFLTNQIASTNFYFNTQVSSLTNRLNIDRASNTISLASLTYKIDNQAIGSHTDTLLATPSDRLASSVLWWNKPLGKYVDGPILIADPREASSNYTYSKDQITLSTSFQSLWSSIWLGTTRIGTPTKVLLLVEADTTGMTYELKLTNILNSNIVFQQDFVATAGLNFVSIATITFISGDYGIIEMSAKKITGSSPKLAVTSMVFQFVE